MMSTPLEHDYIGLSEPSLLERSSEKISSSSSSSSSVCKDDENSHISVNLKETELRLGLPGSGSPARNTINGYNLIPLKNFVSGVKRGFSDTIYGSEKWDLSINGGSCSNLSKSDNLFSPKSNDGGSNNSNSLLIAAKESLAPSINPAAEERKSSCSAPASKARVVGWPPIRSFRKNTLGTNISKTINGEGKSKSGCLYVKVSMDGAPYLRKVDLKTHDNYAELSSALEKMFSCFTLGQCTSDGISGKEGFSESHLMDLLHGSEYVLTYEDKDGDWMLVGDVPWGMFLDSCKRLRIMRSTDAIGLAPRSTQKCTNQTRA